MKKEDLLDERWTEKDGSIFTEQLHTWKSASGVSIVARRGIAYNVGKHVARYLVNLHNQQLAKNVSTSESNES